MIFSYNWLQSLIDRKLPKPKELAQLLTMHSFEIDEVKKVGSDYAIDIDILTNRGHDCFSHIGIVRECAAVLGFKYKEPAVKLKENLKIKTKDLVSLEVKNKNDCSRYTARIIAGVKIGSSPKWMQERLKACGLRPINNIVDIANYVMLETGQPLHAFDLDKVTKQKIVVRRAKLGEKIITLDNENYGLDENVLLIADFKGPIGIAGIKGGRSSGIDEKTTRVIVESANFSPKVIRTGSKRLKLKTDASWRFEHGIDLNLTEAAINMAMALIQKIAGGQITKGLIDFYPNKKRPSVLKLNLKDVEGFLGVKIPEQKIKKILNNLGFDVFGKSGQTIKVRVPTRRLDVLIPEDLIEEVGRIFGLEKIPSVFPQVRLSSTIRNLNLFWESSIRNILKEMGFFEAFTRSFVSQQDVDIFGYNLTQLVELKNPPVIDYQYLRPSLIINLLKILKENQKFSQGIKFFELGNVFKAKKSKIKTENYEEKKMLMAISENSDFYQIKGMVDLLLNKMGISNVWYDDYRSSPEDSQKSFWNPMVSAEIKVDNQEIGFLGEISDKLLKKLKINNSLVVFELDFKKLKEIASQESAYSPVSVYPAAIRDLAVLVPSETKIIDVLNIINNQGGRLVVDVDVFDVYEGEEIPGGKKNFAFHLIYQAEDRTLKSEEIDKIQEKIIKALEKNPEWQVRK